MTHHPAAFSFCKATQFVAGTRNLPLDTSTWKVLCQSMTTHLSSAAGGSFTFHIASLFGKVEAVVPTVLMEVSPFGLLELLWPSGSSSLKVSRGDGPTTIGFFLAVGLRLLELHLELEEDTDISVVSMLLLGNRNLEASGTSNGLPAFAAHSVNGLVPKRASMYPQAVKMQRDMFGLEQPRHMSFPGLKDEVFRSSLQVGQAVRFRMRLRLHCLCPLIDV